MKKPIHNNSASADKSWLPVFEAVEELIRFHEESARDVTDIIQALKSQPASQSLRRTAVRNVAAHIEGVVYVMKRFTLALADKRTVKLAAKESVLLKDERSYTDENGEQKKLGFPRFLENFKFAFAMYAQVNGIVFKLQTGDRRYADFLQSVKIRDRLMHPKGLRDFWVSDPEFVRVGRAWCWYQDQAFTLFSNRTSAVGLRTKFSR